MLFCPNCKCEFSANIKVCSDCGSNLVAEIPSVDESYIEDVPAFLCSLEDAIETEVIVSLLQSNDIPVMKKRPEGGEVLKIYMGTSFYGVEIYVPSKLLADAKELLDAKPVVEQEDMTDDDSKQAERTDARNKRILQWIIIVLFAPGIIWIIVSFILAFLLGACSSSSIEIDLDNIDYKWENILPYSEGLASVNIGSSVNPMTYEIIGDGKWGLINTKGKIVLPVEHRSEWSLRSIHRAAITDWDMYEHEEYEYDDWTWPSEYTLVSSFYEGVAAAQNKDGKWGFIDRENNVIIPFTWDGVGTFADGRASVAVADLSAPHGGKFGYIDREGNIVIPPFFDISGTFNEGFAVVAVYGEDGKAQGIFETAP